MDESQLVFDALDTKNEVSWNALIAGHAMKAQGKHALRLFWKKQGAAPYRIFNLGNTSPVTVPTLVNILEQHMLVYELRLTRLKVWSIFLDDLEFSSLIASAQSPQIHRSWCLSFTVATYPVLLLRRLQLRHSPNSSSSSPKASVLSVQTSRPCPSTSAGKSQFDNHAAATATHVWSA
ncbi:hypothetical protein ACFX11_030724 [Malus domestica]